MDKPTVIRIIPKDEFTGEDNSVSTRPFEYVEVSDGRIGKQWANGLVTEIGTGKWIIPSEKRNVITPENHAEMMIKRKEAVRRAVAKGVALGADRGTSVEAIVAIMEARTKVAINDSSRAGNDAARLVLQMLDVMPREEKKDTVVHEHTVSEDTRKFMEEFAKAREEVVEQKRTEFLEAVVIDRKKEDE